MDKLDPNHIALHKEMMLPTVSETRDVFLDINEIDFSYCEYGRASELKQVTIKNTYEFPVILKWISRAAINSRGEVEKNPFTFSDEEVVIEGNSEVTATVKFRPYEPNYYFF